MKAIAAAFSTQGDAADLVRQMLFAQQGRGSSSIISTERDCACGYGLVSSAFDPSVLTRLSGLAAIGQIGDGLVRSATDQDARVALSGFVTNEQELCKRLGLAEGAFAANSGLIGKMIAVSKASSPEESVAEALTTIRGRYSVAILHAGKLIIASDTTGSQPLMFGQTGQDWVAATESSALEMVGVRPECIQALQPSEIISISEGGRRQQLNLTTSHATHTCAMESICFARGDSLLHGRQAYFIRIHLGKALANETKTKLSVVDVVVPIPETGVPCAIGFAQESGLLYRPAVYAHRYAGRNCGLANFGSMLSHNLKYGVVLDDIVGKRVALVDCMMASGATARAVAHMLYQAGARSVHLLIASPACTSTCPNINRSDLLASMMSHDEMVAYLGVESLTFLSPGRLMQVIGDKTCMGCFSKQK